MVTDEDEERTEWRNLGSRIFDGQKRCTSCPNWGEGGEVIRAMPERKHFFYRSPPLNLFTLGKVFV